MMKKDTVVALALTVTLFIVSTISGYVLLDNSQLASAIEPQESSSYLGAIGHILKTNLPTALSLFSGVITLGIGSLFVVPLVGMFLGASMSVAVDIYGPGEVISRTLFYTPFEVAGFIVAATAGVFPLVVFTRRFFTSRHPASDAGLHRGFGRVMQAVLAQSLKLLGVSLIILVVAALLEGFAVLEV